MALTNLLNQTPGQGVPGQKVGFNGTPFVISGLKANQPGGLNTTQTNILAPKQTADAGNQVAGGNAVNSGTTGGTRTSSLVNPSGGTANPNYMMMVGGQGGSPALNPTGQSGQTGNVQTPSGATVNATSGALINPPPPSTSTFPGIVGALANTATQQNPAVTQGMQGYQGAVQNLSDFNRQLAQQYGNIEQEPIPLEFQQGREQVVARQAASEQAALQGAVTQQQQAISYGQTEQGLAQSGLASAAGLAQPSTTSYGQTVFSPLSASFSSGGTNLDPQTQASSLAQKVISGQMTYDQAIASMGYAGSAGTTFLNNAITSAGGNPLALQSQGAGQQAALQAIPGWQGANVAAQGIASQIQQYLSANPNLNPSQANVANALQQWAQGTQLSDPNYQTLGAYLTEYINTIAPVLGVGGDTTNLKTQVAQSLISGTSQGQTISQVLNNLSNNLATQKIQNYTSGVTGGGVVSNTPPTSTTNATTNTPSTWH